MAGLAPHLLQNNAYHKNAFFSSGKREYDGTAGNAADTSSPVAPQKGAGSDRLVQDSIERVKPANVYATASNAAVRAAPGDRRSDISVDGGKCIANVNSSTTRKAQLLYGDKAVSFGWLDGATPTAFAEQLRSAVRNMLGLESLAGAELHLEVCSPRDGPSPADAPPSGSGTGKAAFRRITPRDLYEGRVTEFDRVHIIVPSASAKGAAGAEVARPAPPPRQSQQKSTGSNRAPGAFQKSGGSQMQFMRLVAANKSPKSRLPPGLKLTAAEVSKHGVAGDCWTIVQGRVYDVTMYMDFHPGGKKQLLKGAGKDCTALFAKIHPWVSIDGLLGQLCLGTFSSSGGPAAVAVDDDDDDDEDDSDEEDATDGDRTQSTSAEVHAPARLECTDPSVADGSPHRGGAKAEEVGSASSGAEQGSGSIFSGNHGALSARMIAVPESKTKSVEDDID